MLHQVIHFVATQWGVPADQLEIALQPIGSGLESTVARARITVNGVPLAQPPSSVVVKVLRGSQRREAAVYRNLWSSSSPPPLAQVLGVQECDNDRILLYLEELSPENEWPWVRPELAATVCGLLAKLHTERSAPGRPCNEWDYDAELERSTVETVALAETACLPSGPRVWRRLGDLRRVAVALPTIRHALFAGGTALIHGDVHPGNVIVEGQSDGTGPRIVLIDWGRARMGSPFEDIACWLHSLGCWEPEARRRHDTLLRAYLDAFPTPRPLTEEIRRLYWYASACNGLSGAIRYFLSIASDPASSEASQWDAYRGISAWERVMKQVSALLATTR